MNMEQQNKVTIIPEFAVLGHPNEGKSSVVSTLTEDDQIRVSSVPGETTSSNGYTVKIDGKKIIRFVDTPGFQVPQQTLAWFQNYQGKSDEIVDQFMETFSSDPFYADECELFKPVAAGAGIIYVVDGSRPVREDDLAEIEILRLTGRPRMAVINSKIDQQDYTSDWEHEFKKSFNAIRIFNSNTAGFKERIAMLESLKPIDQGWERQLSDVIEAFESDWKKRKTLISNEIARTIENSISYSVSGHLPSGADEQPLKEKLISEYQTWVRKKEYKLFQTIRSQFKHHLFDHELPVYSILEHDLFAKQTWELLGLTRRQLASAGAVLGGSVGAVLDTAAAGITFGVFTAIGGALGAGSALWGGKKIVHQQPAGLHLGGNKLVVGPNQNPQFLYILLDRALLYTSQMMNRSHGRRDMTLSNQDKKNVKKGLSTHFSLKEKKICGAFFKAVQKESSSKTGQAGMDFVKLIEEQVDRFDN